MGPELCEVPHGQPFEYDDLVVQDAQQHTGPLQQFGTLLQVLVSADGDSRSTAAVRSLSSCLSHSSLDWCATMKNCSDSATDRSAVSGVRVRWSESSVSV